MDSAGIQHDMVGSSAALAELVRFIARAAPADSTVLIQGESGTGKELVADALHRNGKRSRSPFVAVNCAALPESLMESLLFGHEKGAFTGAVTQQKGKFELAAGGTLFLDEAGELSPSIQAKLLRALQVRAIDRIGGASPIPVDIRLIAATNCDLRQAVVAGKFRQDLYYRLKVLSVKTVPLRDRPGDIRELAQHFVSRFANATGRQVRGISPDVELILQRYGWPGNVRELQNVIESAVVLGSGNLVTMDDLPEELLEGAPHTYQELLFQAKRRIAQDAVARSNGNTRLAARILGLHPAGMHRFLKSLGLPEQ